MGGKFLFIVCFKPFSANFTKWSNTLKQFVGNLPTNYLSVFDHFVRLALKGLNTRPRFPAKLTLLVLFLNTNNLILFFRFQSRWHYFYLKNTTAVKIEYTVRSSRSQMFCKIGALKNFASFTGKHLYSSLILITVSLFLLMAPIGSLGWKVVSYKHKETEAAELLSKIIVLYH